MLTENSSQPGGRLASVLPILRFRPHNRGASLSVVLCLLITSVLGMTLGKILLVTTAWTWIYLPTVLLVTLRWGTARALVVVLGVHVFVLTFMVPPLGAPLAYDPHAYLRLAPSLLGMLSAVLTAGELNRRRLEAERRGRDEAESLSVIGSRVSSSLDLDEVLRTVAESAKRLMSADLAQVALAEVDGALKVVTITGERTERSQGWTIAPGKGVGGRVLSTQAAVQVADYHADPAIEHYPELDSIAAAEGVRSLLAVPILRRTRADGVLWVFSRRSRRFLQREIALLERLAAQAAIGIANARAHEEELAARTEVEALLATTAKLGEQAEPEQVVRTLVEEAAKLLDAERSVYAVLRNGRLMIPADFKDGEWHPHVREARRHGILWSVWETGRPYRSDNVGADPNADLERVRELGVRSNLALALRAPDGENLGLISVTNKRGSGGFSNRDQRLLTAICETGAAILARANETEGRLEAERQAARSKKTVEALLTAADQLNSALEPEEVLLRVVSTAAELLAVRFASIITNEGDHALSRYRWMDGVWRASARRLPLDRSVSGWVITHAQSVRAERHPGDSRLGPLPNGAYVQGAGSAPGESGSERFSMMSVPIIARAGHVLGALHLYDRRDGQPFLDEDQQLAEGIAHHASVALERAAFVKELRERERNLHQQAVTDPLTGLPNRRLFLERLESALAKAGAKATNVAVVFIDLDGFKLVNDSLGHAAGDALLRSVARRLARGKRATDTVARLGGDEFAILLGDVPDEATAISIAQRTIRELEHPFSRGRHQQLVISASAGVGFRSSESMPVSAEDLLRQADIALYQAKGRAKGSVALFELAMGAEASERLALQTELQRAVERGELELYYQPIMRLDTRATVAMEALLRWHHPRRGLLEPAEFISMAEETALIVPIGQWVLREACKQAVVWRTTIPALASLRMCVNLSARQFEQPDLLDLVAAAIAETGLEPTALELEITETAAIQNLSAAIATLQSLHATGVRVAVDDFGTGYSSLSYLKQLPVDTLKLDRSLLEGLGDRGPSAAIVQAATTMAHALGIEVTAEGIEGENQLAAIASLGCDFAQGYLISVPQPAALAPLLACPPVNYGSPRAAQILTA